MNSMHVIGLRGSEALAGALAERLGCGSSQLFTRHFPDGETLVRIDAEVQGCTVVFAGSLDRVDEKTLPLLSTSTTRTSASASARSRCATSSVTSCLLRALRLCGLSRVIVATASDTA